MPNILMAGATGKIGRLVAAGLIERGEHPTAIVRNHEKAVAVLGTGPALIEADLADASALARVNGDFDVAYLAAGQVQDQVEIEKNFIDVAAKLGIGRVVKISAYGRADARLVFNRWHNEIEAYLHSTGMAATILRPNGFNDNLLGSAATIKHGQIYSTTGTGKVAWTDTRDIAAVAIEALLDATHTGRTYTITGPELLDFDQVAGLFTEVLGQPVAHVGIDDATFATSLVQAGLPDWMTQAYVEMYAAIRDGYLEDLSTDVTKVLSRQPIALASWIADNAAAFRP